MYKSVAVLGLGKFGQKMAETLYNNGVDVIVADIDEEIVNHFSTKATMAEVADLMDEESLRGLGLSNVDAVVICMSRHVEASLMAAMVSKELGVKYVLAKASTKRMADILYKVGCDKVINIEEEAAVRESRKLLSTDFIDYFDLDDNLCIINMKPKESWVGKNLKELNLREKFNVNVVAIKEEGGLDSHINPDKPLTKDSTLLLVTEKNNLRKLE